MTTTFNTRTATMSQLVAFFNANTGGNPVKKFADRSTAEKRVQRLVDEMSAEEFVEENTDAEVEVAVEEIIALIVPTAEAPKLDRINAKGPRPAMAQSLKIDRRIVDLLTGEEYANACQVWKAGLVSAAQGDRLSAVLYGAFKTTGKRDATVAINGHTFRLAF